MTGHHEGGGQGGEHGEQQQVGGGAVSLARWQAGDGAVGAVGGCEPLAP